MEELLKTVGALAGITALGWRAFDEWRSYLRLSVSANLSEMYHVLITTAVENKGIRGKAIDNALLLVGPEAETPIETANALFDDGDKFHSTNDLSRITSNAAKEDRAVILLPFYYSENIDIADELLGYTAPLETKKFQVGVPYSVRFYVFGQHRLHRSTQTSFVVPEPKSGGSD